MSLELLIQQNSIAIQKMIENSKDLSELSRYDHELEEDDLMLFRIDSTGETVSMTWGIFLAHLSLLKGDKNYVHKQNNPSSSWVIIHNLNKFPSVTVFDSAGSKVEGDVVYDEDNLNTLTINFNGEFSGTATLN